MKARDFAAGSEQRVTDLAALAKRLFDSGQAAQLQDAGKALGPLSVLVMDNFDDEQMWQQIELRNKPLLRFVETQFKKLHKVVVEEPPAEDEVMNGASEEDENDEDGDDSEIDELADRSEEDEDNEDDEDGEDDEDDEDGEEDEEEDMYGGASRGGRGKKQLMAADFFGDEGDDPYGDVGSDDDEDDEDDEEMDEKAAAGRDKRKQLNSLLNQMEAFADEAENAGEEEEEDLEERGGGEDPR